MYGTIARVKIDPSKLEELKALNRRSATAPGLVAVYLYPVSYTHLTLPTSDLV